MAAAYTMSDTEDDEDTSNSRFFEIPCPTGDSKQHFSAVLNAPLLLIEEAIKPLIRLIDDIATTVYIIKQQLTTRDVNDLTPDESVAIHLYVWERSPPTKCIYYLLNQTILRGLSEELQLWHPYLNLLLAGLHKLPSAGHHFTVYRGIHSCNLSDHYIDDSTYTWWTFGSCLLSLDRMKRPTFLGKYGIRTIFKIDCYSGKRLPQSDDDEVILMPGFHFKVVGQLPSLDDLNTIFVREIPPSSTEIMLPVSVTTRVESPEKTSSLVATTKQHEKSSIKSRRSLKGTANRIMKISKVLHACSNHILELSGQKLSIDELSRTITKRLTSEITVLNLSKTNLVKGKVKLVAEILKSNSTLTELNLSYNPLGNTGCLLIAQTLHRHQTLLTLNLYNTKLSSDAGQCLAEMLSTNYILRSLHLGVNSLGNLGLKYLLSDNVQLHYLNLSCNRINQDGCQYLAHLLEQNQTITDLDMGGNPIRDDGIKILCNGLIHNKTLVDLRVWHCQISNLQPISNLLKWHSTLKYLDFEGNQITDKQANVLLLVAESNKILEKLNISDNRISDDFKKTFQQLPAIRLSIILK